MPACSGKPNPLNPITKINTLIIPEYTSCRKLFKESSVSPSLQTATLKCHVIDHVTFLVAITIISCDLLQEKELLGIFHQHLVFSMDIYIPRYTYIANTVCAEYNGASFKENIDHKQSYEYLYALR